MDESVKKRAYNSPRRQEQARETRKRILEAAQRLFASEGYVAATLPAVAREAGVSPATITVAFGTKLALLTALVRSEVRGDEEPVPVTGRSWWQEMLAEPDPVRQLTLFAGIARRIHGRTTDIAEIVRGAAAVDPELAAWSQELGESRLQDSREVVESLVRKQALSPDITVSRAIDLLWTLGSSEVYRMLVVQRGWPPEQYEQSLASLLVCSLLGWGQSEKS
jgi:TetR/AcrR family transcriptional regulator of autoinduction and epiphytic fitness